MIEFLANESSELNSSPIDSSIAILFTIIAVIIVAGLAVLFFYLIRRERDRYVTERLKNGVMNKARFNDFVRRRIKIAKRTSRFAVAFIKILGDDELYNSLGAKQYEAMLKALNERVYAIMPIGTKLCNYEQGIVAVFIDQNMDQKGLEDVSLFCVNECKKPIELVTRVKVSVSVNIGVATFDFDKNKDHLQYIANAQMALRTAEKAGANSYYVYTPELDFSEDEKYRFFRDMKKAGVKNEYVLYYGAVRAASGVTTGFYGKLYRDSEDNGLIPGEKFIPALVQSGEIINVGNVAFTALCEAVRDYMASTGKEPIFSYYATARETATQSTAALMYKAVKGAKILPGEICVVTDEFKSESVLSTLKKLKDYGFLIGGILTEENSADLVTAVEKLGFDRIEIPVSYIVGERATFYYKGLCDMLSKYALSCGASLTVTGIETKEQMTEAAELGATDFIGFISNEQKTALEAEPLADPAVFAVKNEELIEEPAEEAGEEREDLSEPIEETEEGAEE